MPLPEPIRDGSDLTPATIWDPTQLNSRHIIANHFSAGGIQKTLNPEASPLQSRLRIHSPIPDHVSCSLWVTNLNITLVDPERELLRSIRYCGKIFACVINSQDPRLGHTTSSAELVFLTLEGA